MVVRGERITASEGKDMKRNKIRYQSKPKERKPIVMTGLVLLQFRDDEAAEQAVRGDLLIYPQNDALQTTRMGEYEGTGFSGYFKIDVCDGKSWCPVVLNEVFPDREHHFGKSDRPIDVYALCLPLLVAMKGRNLLRIYREHYELEV